MRWPCDANEMNHCNSDAIISVEDDMHLYRYRKTCLMVLVGLALSVCSVNASAAQKVYKFNIQTAVPNSSLYFKLLTKFADQIRAMSGGQLQAEILPSGAIVPPFQIQAAVSHGVVNAGFAWPNYWSGKNSAYILFTNVPASTGMDQRTLMAWYYQGPGKKLFQHLNQDIMGLNIVAFLIQPMGPDPLGWFSKPITSMKEFATLKYRTPPGIAGQTYNAMGVAAVSLPGAEIVPAAQRGVIDAAEWIGPADDRNLGLYKIWKYYYLQGLHQQSDMGELVINRDFWKSLPKSLQAIIRVAAKAQVAMTLNSNIYDNSKAIQFYKNKADVHVLDTPEGYYEDFITKQKKITQQYAEDNKFFAKVLKSQRKFSRMTYPYWSRVQVLYNNLVQTAHETTNKPKNK